MQRHNEQRKTGHLLYFVSHTLSKDNFGLFLPVEGLAQFDDILKVVDGFQHCSESIADKYRFSHHSVSDIGQLEELFPEVNRSRLLRFEPFQFLDSDKAFVEGFAHAVLDRQAAGTVQALPLLRTGGKASGANFFDREQEMQKLHELIIQRKNLLLRAPRRFGKSSLLTRLAGEPPSGNQVCYIDLQGGKSPEDFIIFILKALAQRKEFCSLLPAGLTNAYELSESERRDLLKSELKEIASDWQQYTETLFTELDKSPFKAVLVLDEFPWLIEDMIELHPYKKVAARNFLRWFVMIRKLESSPVFILSGSEHLPSFLASHGLTGLMDDLEPFQLGLFETDTARNFAFLALAGQQVVVTREETDHILRLLGRPIPYFLQLFLDFLAEKCWAGEILQPEDMERYFYQDLLGPSRTRAFEAISLQLDRYRRFGSKHRDGAAAILDLLANKEQAERQEVREAWLSVVESADGFDTMLALLRDDFYVEEADNMIFMSSKLLREWWARHQTSGMPTH